MLLLATLFWGVSFPVMKAFVKVVQQSLPHAGSWFITSSAVFIRFAVPTLLALIWSWKTLGQMTRLEIWEGIGLGVFGGAGILLQMDGLAYTSASTSAFLTQCYCLFLPVVVAARDRKWPSTRIAAASFMVIVGVATLAKVDWQSLKLGRGEWETLLGAFIFTGQILWLERPLFAANRVRHFTLVMFGATALIALPVALVTTQKATDWWIAYSLPASLGFTAVLVVFCTLGAYSLMNYWQPKIPATEAGVIYCAEPVFASLFALFLPAWFSGLAGVNYPNETITWSLAIGGGLITAANFLVQSREKNGTSRNANPSPALQAEPNPR